MNIEEERARLRRMTPAQLLIELETLRMELREADSEQNQLAEEALELRRQLAALKKGRK